MIFNKNRTLEEGFRIINYEIKRRAWLYMIGLRETHGILYFREYGKWFHKKWEK